MLGSLAGGESLLAAGEYPAANADPAQRCVARHALSGCPERALHSSDALQPAAADARLLRTRRGKVPIAGFQRLKLCIHPRRKGVDIRLGQGDFARGRNRPRIGWRLARFRHDAHAFLLL